MFKLFVFVLCFEVAVVKISHSAVAIMEPQEKPWRFACQEGCYQPEQKIVIPYNSSYYPQDGKSCVQIYCQADGWTSFYTCGVISAPECTRVTGDKFKPYPNCCDYYDCPNATGPITAVA